MNLDDHVAKVKFPRDCKEEDFIRIVQALRDEYDGEKEEVRAKIHHGSVSVWTDHDKDYEVKVEMKAEQKD